MIIGYHSPLPPARTGVADYALALLKAMGKREEVEIDALGDINLYQLGNNQLHKKIHERALRYPGVVLLHDALLHHFYLGCLKRDEYIEEFVFNYGEWSRPLARRLWERRGRSAADPEYFQYPMLRRICETSSVVIVHNPAAVAMVRKHAPKAEIVEIPHLFEIPRRPPDQAIAAFRENLHIEKDTFVFGVFGHLRESKRLSPVLRAFEQVRKSIDAVLLVSGEFVSTDLERAVAPLLDSPGVRRLPFAEEESEFWRRAYATDCCINLRYPAAGETSGIAVRFMGIGKPVMLSDGMETNRFPAGTCVKVDTGLAEESMVADCMAWLCNFRENAREIGERAANHIGQFHNVNRVADLFWETLLAARSMKED